MIERAEAECRPRLSVVIPAYNEERYIAATLENVQRAIEEYRLKKSGAVEIVVVNNNCTDRTEEIARMHGATVVFEGNNNIAASRNAGAKAARGEILAFLDADDHMSSNLLWLVDDRMSSGHYVGGGVKIRWDKMSAPLALYNGFVGLLRGLFRLSTGLIYTHKQTFERLGGFDEAYYAAEESKFVWDLKRLGRAEGKKFHVIKDGYVIKSARKFEEFGWGALAEAKFLLKPQKFKDPQACAYWYQRRKT